MDEFIRDVRFALRGIRKAPGFTAVAVATIALGIGVNASIFSLVNATLLRPLPVESPGELVDVYAHQTTDDAHNSSSYPNFVDFRDQAETLSGMMAFTNFFANLSVDGSSEIVVGEIVSEDYFSVLGVPAALGRTFTSEEFAGLGAGPSAVLSHAFWANRFGADPGVLGRAIRINGSVYTVVGVAPRTFGGMAPAMTVQMWLPLSMVDDVEPLGSNWVTGPQAEESVLDRRARHFLWVKGRIKEGIEVERVRAEMTGIAARLAQQYPEANERVRVKVLATNDVALNPDFDRTLAPVSLVLLGAVGLVLLVACANLANMMLARGASRRREMAIRTAIGAGRGRIIRQLVTESMLLALLGGVVALGLSYWLAGVIAAVRPPLPIEIGLDISPDWRVGVFTFAAAVVTGLVFGLVPAARASRPDLVPALKDAGDGAATRAGRLELRDILVIAQVAVSVVLLVGGALMARSLGAASGVDLGYDARRTAYFGLAMEMNGYDGEQAEIFFQGMQERLEALPEVEGVANVSRVPLSLNNNGFGLFLDGHQASADDTPYRMDGAYVDEGYFDVLGLEIVAGRGIETADRDENLRVAVVTEAMARRYWPDRNGVGQSFRTSWEGEPWQIVGVVEDYRVDTPGESPKDYIHLPLGRNSGYGNLLVGTRTDATPLLPALEREFRALDPDLVFVETGTLWTLAEVRLFPVRAGAWLIGAFGLLAVLLAAVGLYGVVGYSVSRRIREIGIRKALGAQSNEVVGMVVARGMVLVGGGAVVGIILAALAARALTSALYVPALDPLSFGLALVLLVLVGLLAHWIPARRAAGIDPTEALRRQ